MQHNMGKGAAPTSSQGEKTPSLSRKDHVMMEKYRSNQYRTMSVSIESNALIGIDIINRSSSSTVDINRSVDPSIDWLTLR